MKENTATSENFNFVDGCLKFTARVPKEADYTIDSVCKSCPVLPVCFGESFDKFKKARINLSSPLVAFLLDPKDVPCGAGIKMTRRSSHK